MLIAAARRHRFHGAPPAPVTLLRLGLGFGKVDFWTFGEHHDFGA